MKSNKKSPGVYIDEINAFPNSIVPIASAIPAFIGYTPQAMYEGKSYTNVPQKITSFMEFQAIYCYPAPAPPASRVKQYKPEYYLVKAKQQPEKGDYIMIGTDYYSIVPDPDTIYYLYNSVRLFYENGGGDAYIVSVGTYGVPSKSPITAGNQIINSNVKLNDLLKGLAFLIKEEEPTMYICPEATLLTIENNATLMQEMLLQNAELQTAISIFDIIGGQNPDPILYTNDIKTFRDSTGANGLNYGTAYYPFIGTTIMQPEDIHYTNLFGGNVKQLEPLLNPVDAPNPTVVSILKNIETSSEDQLTVRQYDHALRNASKTYETIMTHVLSNANILPPSGGMAGVITKTDYEAGPWKAPANTSIVGAVSLPIHLSDAQQGELNIDAVSGKSINAIRFFNGLGILIWGARTLDGNSLDWRYLPVSRTLIFLEQSCRLAIQAFVFEPNDRNTWERTKSMINSFLTTIWREGALQGDTSESAFFVKCGLGTTMTAENLLNGVLRVTVGLALLHPAEFIVFSFEQQMPTPS